MIKLNENKIFIVIKRKRLKDINLAILILTEIIVPYRFYALFIYNNDTEKGAGALRNIFGIWAFAVFSR